MPTYLYVLCIPIYIPIYLDGTELQVSNPKYEERIEGLVGFYPREQSKRGQLIKVNLVWASRS